jgi:hypothetical protein
MRKLTRQELQTFLKTVGDSFPHDACLTCECFLGFVTRLQIDSDKCDHDLIGEYKVEKKLLHSCLGCDPCPQGDMYAEYVRKKAQLGLIILS